MSRKERKGRKGFLCGLCVLCVTSDEITQHWRSIRGRTYELLDLLQDAETRE